MLIMLILQKFLVILSVKKCSFSPSGPRHFHPEKAQTNLLTSSPNFGFNRTNETKTIQRLADFIYNEKGERERGRDFQNIIVNNLSSVKVKILKRNEKSS